MRSPLRSPAQVEGTQGFLPQPEKDLERPSSTRLEARFPSHGSRAMTRSSSPLALGLDFPGAPREATNHRRGLLVRKENRQLQRPRGDSRPEWSEAAGWKSAP